MSKNSKKATKVKLGKAVSDPGDIDVYTQYKIHQTTYEKVVTFPLSKFDSASRSWIHPLLSEMRRISKDEPIGTQFAIDLKRPLEIAIKLPEWLALVSKNKSDITVEDVIALFAALDQTLIEDIAISESMAAKFSLRFRNDILSHAREHSQDGRIDRIKVLYRSPLSMKSKGRELISDLADGVRAPINSLSYATISELREQTKNTLEGDLNRIVEACKDVLARHQGAVAKIEEMKRTHIPKNIEMFFREAHDHELRGRLEISTLSPEHLDYLVIFAVQLATGTIGTVDSKWKKREEIFQNSRSLVPILRKKLNDISNGDSIPQLVKIEDILSAEVLLACALILQCFTGWNFISVLELTKDDIAIVSFPHQLQSVKPRTGDHTPPVFVEKSDEGVILACRILQSRLDRLALAGRIAPTEQRLWISSRALFGKGEIHVISGWQTHLKPFISRYNLPKFSLEQIRVQVLAAISVDAGGLSAAKSRAGHRLHSTTNGYVDKLLLQRFNSSINYEFEKRLEATIHYMMDPSSVDPNQLLITYPIGDGSSCREPHQPPDTGWLDAGICNGHNCHSNQGCPNRVLKIDFQRIEEVVRTKAFYESNWTRLAEENEIAFEQQHLPVMLFNYVLFGVLRRGPFRHLVQRNAIQSY